MAEMTPMMRQYMEIKEQNKDSILFFRLGDFYEMFGDDARKASRELDLTLTTRDKDKNKSFEEKIPMCGIPYHASDAYIARLIAKGYKVAICEQMEDPALAKGLVDRDIIRIITPGTVMTSSMRLAHQPAIRAEANSGVNTSSGMSSMVYTSPEYISTLAHMGVSL